ncbi:hypothetical protein [Psychromonas ossibalaenae]|uniref:hypothetical protein n=1 Tax=Psychromonas ossibalaenae TaxID=444922 RepID=UPI000382248B|nr:hypothetical protein [Psychromonas ossibalaenae]
MINRENNPHRRLVEPDDLVRFADELLIGAIGPGVRSVSTEVQGDRVRWRCIFESYQSMKQDRPPLEEIQGRLQGIFYWHAKVDGEYLVMSREEEMAHLGRLLFLRREV